jgi:hypothetical protein
MPVGPGKYDEWCTAVRDETHAGAVILIVFQGEHGSGFSVQAPIEVTLRLPAILRDVAAEIERDLPRLTQ